MYTKMLHRKLYLLLLISRTITYEQSDYVLKLERVEVVDYNKDHVIFAKTANFKYNRTAIATNFTLNMKTAFRNDLKVAVQGYKFASNEYRLFPIVFTVDICNTIAKNDFGLQNLYSCGNFSRCPLQTGNYFICNWSPDESKFPPYIPPGGYMIDLKMIYQSVQILNAQGYATVKRIADFAPPILN